MNSIKNLINSLLPQSWFADRKNSDKEEEINAGQIEEVSDHG